MREEPGDAAGDAAGGERPPKPPEYSAQETARDHHHDKQQRQHIVQTPRGAPNVIGLAASGSPLTTAIICSTPASMPPSKSPCLKCGAMVSSMIRFAIASGSAPSKPVADFDAHAPVILRDQEHRTVIHAFASELPCSATRIPYCSISSGCVVGTTSTAIWLPLWASRAASSPRAVHRLAGQDAGQVDDARRRVAARHRARERDAAARHRSAQPRRA